MASPSPSDRDHVAAGSGAMWEVGLIAMPTVMLQEDGSAVRPLIALVLEASRMIRCTAVGPSDQPLMALEPAIADALHNPKAACRPGWPRVPLKAPAMPTAKARAKGNGRI